MSNSMDWDWCKRCGKWHPGTDTPSTHHDMNQEERWPDEKNFEGTPEQLLRFQAYERLVKRQQAATQAGCEREIDEEIAATEEQKADYSRLEAMYQGKEDSSFLVGATMPDGYIFNALAVFIDQKVSERIKVWAGYVKPDAADLIADAERLLHREMHTASGEQIVDRKKFEAKIGKPSNLGDALHILDRGLAKGKDQLLPDGAFVPSVGCGWMTPETEIEHISISGDKREVALNSNPSTFVVTSLLGDEDTVIGSQVSVSNGELTVYGMGHAGPVAIFASGHWIRVVEKTEEVTAPSTNQVAEGDSPYIAPRTPFIHLRVFDGERLLLDTLTVDIPKDFISIGVRSDASAYRSYSIDGVRRAYFKTKTGEFEYLVTLFVTLVGSGTEAYREAWPWKDNEEKAK